MIRETRSHTLLSAITLLLVMAWLPGPVLGADDDDDGFRFWVDPIDLWILEQDQDTESSKFQEYRDLSSGFWSKVNLYGETADGGDRNFAIRLRGIGREDARYTMDYRLEGAYSFELDYNKIPHRFGNDAYMPWDRPRLNQLEFPDPVQGLETDDILAFVESADRINLGLRRDRTHARFDHGKLSKLAWTFDYQRENRNGDRPLGVAFGFGNVQEIPEPIDYNTEFATISGEFNGKNGGVRVGFTHSNFENKLGDVIWDNPFNSEEADRDPSRGRFDLAPDNESNFFFADGRGRTGNWWFNGSAGLNTISQDDALLPYTINSAITGVDTQTGATFPAASAGLPVDRADNEAEIVNFSANIGNELSEDWSLVLRLRYYDYDNSSPRIEFPGYVRLDERWEEDRLITVPYSYTRDEISLQLLWDVTSTTNLSLSYGQEGWDREFRETTDTEEDLIKLTIDSRPSDKVSLRASYANGDRSISQYRTEAQLVFFVEPHGIDNLPGLRKYDQAVRDVDDYDLLVQLYPNDAWNFTLGFSGVEESYDQSQFGLISDDTGTFHFELGYTPGANLNFYLFGHNEDRDVFQRNRQSGSQLSTNPQDNWTAAFNEDTVTWGLGVNAMYDSGWSWDLSAYGSDSDGEIDFTTPPGGSPSEAVDIDNYEDIELLSAWLKVAYQLNQNIRCGAFFLYEDYTIDSFITQGLQPFIAGTLLLVPNDADYQAEVFGVNMRVVF